MGWVWPGYYQHPGRELGAAPGEGSLTPADRVGDVVRAVGRRDGVRSHARDGVDEVIRCVCVGVGYMRPQPYELPEQERPGQGVRAHRDDVAPVHRGGDKDQVGRVHEIRRELSGPSPPVDADAAGAQGPRGSRVDGFARTGPRSCR